MVGAGRKNFWSGFLSSSGDDRDESIINFLGISRDDGWELIVIVGKYVFLPKGAILEGAIHERFPTCTYVASTLIK